jgi:hypothetical protein
VTRSPKTVPPDDDSPLQATAGDREQQQHQAAAMEAQRETAVQAWKMGRRLGAAGGGARVRRIPRMHPGMWRSGR